MSNRERLDSIEVLRGFAALLVILAHVLALGGFNGLNLHYTTKVSHYFGLAVPLFYAISAFSLLYGYNEKIFTEFDIKRFYIRRYFRLAPLFYVMILAWGIWMYVRFKVKYDPTTIITNMTMMFGLIPTKQESLVAGGWSVGIEWIFYLSFPLFVSIIRSKALTVISFVLALIISIQYTSLTSGVLQASPSLNYMAIMKHIVFFIAGGIAYKLLAHIQQLKEKFGLIQNIGIVYLLIGFGSFELLTNRVDTVLLEAILFIFLLCWAVVGFTKILNNKLTRLFGKFSYSLYLLNPLIIVFLNELHVYDYIRNLIKHNDISFAVSSLITIFTITAISFITYYFIEQPGIKTGQILIDKIKNKQILTNNINYFQSM